MAPGGVGCEMVEVLFFSEVREGIEAVPESVAKIIHVQIVVVDLFAVVDEDAQTVVLLLNQGKEVPELTDTFWSGVFSTFRRETRSPCRWK